MITIHTIDEDNEKFIEAHTTEDENGEPVVDSDYIIDHVHGHDAKGEKIFGDLTTFIHNNLENEVTIASTDENTYIWSGDIQSEIPKDEASEDKPEMPKDEASEDKPETSETSETSEIPEDVRNIMALDDEEE